MKTTCPHCNKSFEIPNKTNIKKPDMVVIEETDNDITSLVTKKVTITTPTVGDIENNTYHRALPNGEYWKQIHKKDLIVLHYTAGYTWQSAYSTFKRPLRIATPYIIDKEGPKYIVKLFDEKYWAYHLGIKGRESRNWFNDKRSIGIEIVNIGTVNKVNGQWKNYVGKVCPPEQVVEGKNRDAGGNVKFPNEQVDAVCDLINYLCHKYDIPKQVPKDKMANQLPAIHNFKGIVTHQMFRDDKYDMGVAWPWDKVIEKCGLQEVSLS